MCEKLLSLMDKRGRRTFSRQVARETITQLWEKHVQTAKRSLFTNIKSYKYQKNFHFYSCTKYTNGRLFTSTLKKTFKAFFFSNSHIFKDFKDPWGTLESLFPLEHPSALTTCCSCRRVGWRCLWWSCSNGRRPPCPCALWRRWGHTRSFPWLLPRPLPENLQHVTDIPQELIRFISIPGIHHKCSCVFPHDVTETQTFSSFLFSWYLSVFCVLRCSDEPSLRSPLPMRKSSV